MEQTFRLLQATILHMMAVSLFMIKPYLLLQ